MKKVISWISGLLRDEKGTPSSKRFVGIVLALTLAITMYANSFTEDHFAPSTILVESVALLAFGCLGLSSIDKLNKKSPVAPKSDEKE